MKKLIITVIIIIVLVFIAGVAYFLYMTQGPDLSQFEYLKDPQISIKENQKVLVVEAKGDPNIVGEKAFGLVFNLYFKIKDAPKGPGQLVPRARWPISLDTPQSEWIGLYAMPVPENTTELPEHEADPELTVTLEMWEYGDVAEILHIGPYDKEPPTVQRLLDFVKAQGYTVTGVHEEEYLKGPTMFSKGNPEAYVTIIRYRVTKADEL